MSQQLFDALADQTRRDIVEILASHGQMSATEICDKFTISHPAVSQHLRVLREARLVHLEKRAQKHIYSLRPDAMRELEGWVKRMTQVWDERFDALDRVLKAEKRKSAKRKNAHFDK